MGKSRERSNVYEIKTNFQGFYKIVKNINDVLQKGDFLRGIQKQEIIPDSLDSIHHKVFKSQNELLRMLKFDMGEFQISGQSIIIPHALSIKDFFANLDLNPDLFDLDNRLLNEYILKAQRKKNWFKTFLG
ncbi:MAG: hypothetical protein GF347_01520 [Candidatus Moranbacteria bacterium]|nr:hypothetical protein [Candidatus Moranbacteria bacterium]